MNILGYKTTVAKHSFIITIFFGITAGISIASEKWLYCGFLLVPLIIYLCIEKPFIFPFGVYVALLPFEPLLVVSETQTGQGTTLLKYIGLLTISFFLFKGAFEKKLRWPDNASLWWVFFVLYGVLSILWAEQPGLVRSKIPTAIGLFLLYYIASSYEIKNSEFNTLKWCIFVGGVIAAVYSILEFSASTDIRATIGSGNANNVAFNFLIPFSVGIAVMMERRIMIMKWLLGIGLGTLLFSIIITGSRGGFLGAGVIVIIYILYTRQKVTFATIMIIIGIILMSFIPDFFIERWEGAIESGGTGRLYIWRVGLMALGKYWPFGVGLNNFTQAFDEFGHHATFLRENYGSHNIYLGYFVQLGIIGFSFMMIAIIKHYRLIKSLAVDHNFNHIMLKAAFWGILVSSLFLDTTWKKPFWLIWMMIMMHKNVFKNE